ncbi:MAG: type II/IV secretion system ATPase subunit [Candidatus Micrarchaeia archaeon]
MAKKNGSKNGGAKEKMPSLAVAALAEPKEISASDIFEQLRLAHKRKRELSQGEAHELDSGSAQIHDEVNALVEELAEHSVRKKRARLEGRKMDFGPADELLNEKMRSIYSRARALATGATPPVGPAAVTAAQKPEALESFPATPMQSSEMHFEEGQQPTAPGAKARACPPEYAFQVIETIVDAICRRLEAEKDSESDLDKLAAAVGVSTQRIEEIGRMLREANIAEVSYPVNVFSRPRMRLLGVRSLKKLEEPEGTKIGGCSFVSSSIPATVHILESRAEERPLYWMNKPRVGPYTESLLAYLRDELAREIPVQTEEITDSKHAEELKERLMHGAAAMLDTRLPELSAPQKSLLSGMLLNLMYGLGEIELLMADDDLEEIGVNSAAEPVSVYHRRFGWMKTNVRINTEEEIYNYASQIGRKSGREITVFNPVMDAWLPSGDRVSATLQPISSEGNTITIRRFARNPWTITNFIDPQVNTMSVDMAAFMWLCVQYELNVLVAGGTASGKTSTLNTLCAMIPSSHRTITIEDTRELQLPAYLKWNWISLATRGPNPEGKGEVGMLDLMLNSLRMRPDRIVLGEIRRQAEAEVLFEAMHTGHAVYSTIHADNAKQALRRLVEPPIALPTSEIEALQVVLVQYRDRRKGIRRTYEIAEVSPAGAQSKEMGVNTLFRWHPRTDSFEKMGESTRVFSELGMHTGLTVKEMQADLLEKQDVLTWMYAHGITATDMVGSTMRAYYKNPAKMVDAARENADPKTVL